MATDPENKFDSGHAIIPVKVGDEIHHVAVPEDTPVRDLHAALVNHVVTAPDVRDSAFDDHLKLYAAPSPEPVDNPTRQGVLENSPAFKKAALDVWDASGRGRNSNEAGVGLDDDLKAEPVQTSTKDNKMSIRVPASSKILLHSHPNNMGGQPSPQDIDSAKALGKTIYVVSKRGLQAVDKFGKVTNVYSDADWTQKDNNK
jgi:hypothetical protein